MSRNARIEFCEHRGFPVLRLGDLVSVHIKLEKGVTLERALRMDLPILWADFVVRQGIILWGDVAPYPHNETLQAASERRAACGYSPKTDTSFRKLPECTDGYAERGGTVESTVRELLEEGIMAVLVFLEAEANRLHGLVRHSPSDGGPDRCLYKSTTWPAAAPAGVSG